MRIALISEVNSCIYRYLACMKDSSLLARLSALRISYSHISRTAQPSLDQVTHLDFLHHASGSILFWIPIFLIRFWLRCNLAIVAMSEASLYKNDLAMLGQNYVRATGQIVPLQSESIAMTVQDRSHGQFWLHVFTANAAHRRRTCCWRNRVHEVRFSLF